MAVRPRQAARVRDPRAGNAHVVRTAVQRRQARHRAHGRDALGDGRGRCPGRLQPRRRFRRHGQRGRRASRHRRARAGRERHRLHRPRAGLDVLEQGPRPGPDIPRDRRGARLVGTDGTHCCGESRRGGRSARRASAAQAFAVSAAPDLHARRDASPREPAEGILAAIGGTPLVALRRLLLRPDVSVWAKLEASNPGGSAKDRPAARMLGDALDRGLIDIGTTIVESSSGNMGIGLAQVCRYHGMRLIVVVDSRAHAASVRAMRALGAEVRVITQPDAQTGDLLVARMHEVHRLLEQTPNSFWPDQYANESNPAAHADGTMREIDEALEGDLDYLFVATSTTGTLRGSGDYLREHGRSTRLVAVDSTGSALFGGVRDRRLLPGFGAGVETSLSAGAEFDELVRVSDLDCVVGCRRLAEREAILAGASSGGVAFAVEELAAQMEPGSRCAAIFADGGAGYLETVYDDAWVERELRCPPARLAALVAEGE